MNKRGAIANTTAQGPVRSQNTKREFSFPSLGSIHLKRQLDGYSYGPSLLWKTSYITKKSGVFADLAKSGGTSVSD